MRSLFLDALGAPDLVFRGLVILFVVIPFLFAGAAILFFRFLDWYSNRKKAKK